MSSSKSTAAKERDSMKAKLAAMVSSPKAPGTKQAERALKPESAKKEAKPSKPDGGASPSASSPKKPKAKRAKMRGKAEKVSVSFHPEDLQRLEEVDDQLRTAGVITRRAPVSLLIKVALAAFDAKRVENIDEIVADIKSQDGRGKWLQDLKARKDVK